MKLLLVGGFLGAGKTTLISNILPEMLTNNSVAILENEYGDTSIDSTLLGSKSIKIATISGGCVCCQLSGCLIGALAEIEEEINPDWCIIELSGMAITSNILATIRQYYRKDIEILTIVVCDASRWDKLHKIVGPRLEAQLDGADALILSKTQLTSNLPSIDFTLPVIPSNQLTLAALEHIFHSRKQRDNYNVYENTEGNVVCNHYTFDGKFSISDIRDAIKEIIKPLAEEVMVSGIIPGHIKALATFTGGYISASMTSLHDLNYSYSQNKNETVTNYNLTVIRLLSN